MYQFFMLKIFKIIFSSFKKVCSDCLGLKKTLLMGVEEMTQWLRAMAVPSKNPGFNFLHTHGSSQLSAASVLKDLASLHRHTCRLNTNTNKSVIKKKLFIRIF